MCVFTLNIVPLLRLFARWNVCAPVFLRLSFARLLLVYIEMKMHLFFSALYSCTEEGRI